MKSSRAILSTRDSEIHATGDLKPELMGERVLSAIIEIKVSSDQLSRAAYGQRGRQGSR